MRKDFYNQKNVNCTQASQVSEEKEFETLYNQLVARVSDLDYYSGEIFNSVSKLRVFELNPEKQAEQKATDIVSHFAIKIEELGIIKSKLIQIDNVLKGLV